MTEDDPFAEPPRERGRAGVLAQGLRDPAQRATWIGLLLVVTGLVLGFFGYRGVAATLDVYVQLPFALSGGLGGLALVGAGLALCNAQAARYAEALDRAAEQRLVEAWTDLESLVTRRR